jgi:membrane-associated phospholipid phosphatase
MFTYLLCQLGIERPIVLLLLTTALSAFDLLLPPTAQAQNLARVAPDSAFVTDDAATSDASAGDWPPAGPPPTPEDLGIKSIVLTLFDGVKHLPSRENLYWAAAGGAGALAVHPADTQITESFAKASWTDGFFALGDFTGQFGVLVAASVGVYGVGRATGKPKVAYAGRDLIDSVVLAQAIVKIVKVATQRERPDGSDRLSFPSGHSGDTFAFATALERHLGWKGAIPGYIFSSYVAISRVNDQRHFMSDVVMGSAVGIIAGRTVTRPDRKLPVTLVPVPGGAAIMYARRGE